MPIRRAWLSRRKRNEALLSESADWKPLASVAFLITAFAIATMAVLNSHGFWWDEWLTLQAISMPPDQMILDRAQCGHPPLYFLLLQGWSWLFGTTETALRLPSVFFTLVSASLVYRIGSILAGRWAGVAGAFLLLASPTVLWLSMQARGNTMTMCLTLASVGWLIECLSRDRRRADASILALCAFACLSTHYATTLVLLTQLLCLLWRRPVRRDLVLGLILGAAAALPFAAMTIVRTGPSTPIAWIGSVGWMSLPSLLSQQVLGENGTALSPMLAIGTAGILGLIALMGIRTIQGPSQRLLLAAWAGPILLGLILSATGYPDVTRIARYFTTSIAIQALLIGVALVRLEKWSLWVRTGVLVTLGVICALADWDIVTRGNAYPYRDAAKLVDNKVQPNEAVIFAGPTFEFAPWLHYAHSPTYDLFHPDRLPMYTFSWKPLPANPASQQAEHFTLDESVRGVWVLVHKGVTLTPIGQAALNDLMARFPQREEFEVKGQTVLHLHALPVMASPDDGDVTNDMELPISPDQRPTEGQGRMDAPTDELDKG